MVDFHNVKIIISREPQVQILKMTPNFFLSMSSLTWFINLIHSKDLKKPSQPRLVGKLWSAKKFSQKIFPRRNWFYLPFIMTDMTRLLFFIGFCGNNHCFIPLSLFFWNRGGGGIFLITPQRLGILPWNFALVINFQLHIFWYKKISKYLSRGHQQVV